MRVNGCFSEYVIPIVGVRKGKIYSPFYLQYVLMALTVFSQNNVTGVTGSSSEFDDNILIFVRLFYVTVC